MRQRPVNRGRGVGALAADPVVVFGQRERSSGGARAFSDVEGVRPSSGLAESRHPFPYSFLGAGRVAPWKRPPNDDAHYRGEHDKRGHDEVAAVGEVGEWVVTQHWVHLSLSAGESDGYQETPDLSDSNRGLDLRSIAVGNDVVLARYVQAATRGRVEAGWV